MRRHADVPAASSPDVKTCTGGASFLSLSPRMDPGRAPAGFTQTTAVPKETEQVFRPQEELQENTWTQGETSQEEVLVWI